MAKKWLYSIEKQKKKQFEIFAKIAQILLPWQQIKIRRTTFFWFLSRRTDGQEMARIHRETKKKNRFEGALQTYRQSQQQKIVDS